MAEPGIALPETQRNPQLDGLRACAALAVATFHSVLEIDPSQVKRILFVDIWAIPHRDWANKVVLAVANGQTAVALFFVLSGAVLFNTLRRRGAGPWEGSAEFVIRRLFRIFPTLFVSLALFTLVIAVMGDHPTARQFWTNALLLDNPIQGESWTLQVEILAVPFILLSFYVWRLAGPVGILGCYVSVWLLFLTPWLSPWLSHPRSYALCFVIGFLIPTPSGAWLADHFPARAWPLVLAVIIAARHVIPGTVFSVNTDPLAIGLLFASAGILVLLLYYNRAGGLGSFLQRPMAARLGRMSYSFYLYNVIFIRIVSVLLLRHTSARAHPLGWGLILAALVTALTIPVAWLSELYVERPSVRAGRKLIRFFGVAIDAAERPARSAGS